MVQDTNPRRTPNGPVNVAPASSLPRTAPNARAKVQSCGTTGSEHPDHANIQLTFKINPGLRTAPSIHYIPGETKRPVDHAELTIAVPLKKPNKGQVFVAETVTGELSESAHGSFKSLSAKSSTTPSSESQTPARKTERQSEQHNDQDADDSVTDSSVSHTVTDSESVSVSATTISTGPMPAYIEPAVQKKVAPPHVTGSAHQAKAPSKGVAPKPAPEKQPPDSEGRKLVECGTQLPLYHPSFLRLREGSPSKHQAPIEAAVSAETLTDSVEVANKSSFWFGFGIDERGVGYPVKSESQLPPVPRYNKGAGYTMEPHAAGRLHPRFPTQEEYGLNRPSVDTAKDTFNKRQRDTPPTDATSHATSSGTQDTSPTDAAKNIYGELQPEKPSTEAAKVPFTKRHLVTQPVKEAQPPHVDDVKAAHPTRKTTEEQAHRRRLGTYHAFMPAPVPQDPNQKKRRIFFVRHGERMDRVFPQWLSMCFTDQGLYTPYDMNQPSRIPGRIGGHLRYYDDPPLTEIGHLMSQMVGKGLFAHSITVNRIYVSSALRCVQTAQSLARILSGYVTIAIEPGLFEWPGHYDEMPAFMSPKELKQVGYDIDLDYKPIYSIEQLSKEKGLSILDLYDRLHRVTKQIVDKETDAPNIIIVAHAVNLDAGPVYLQDSSRDVPTVSQLQRLGLKYPYCAVVAMDEIRGKWRQLHNAILPISFLGSSNRVNTAFPSLNDMDLQQKLAHANFQAKPVQSAVAAT